MASVLSLSPFTPFYQHDVERPGRPSISSLGSVSAGHNLRQARQHHLSISSLLSKSSFNTPSSRRIPGSIAKSVAAFPALLSAVPQELRQTRTSLLQTAFSEPALTQPTEHSQRLLGRLDADFDQIHESSETEGRDSDSEVDIWHEPTETFDDTDIDASRSTIDQETHLQSQAFKRWVSTLRRRNAGSPSEDGDVEQITPDDGKACPDYDLATTMIGHRRSGSHISSMAFVTGVRSASMTMTNASLPSIHHTASPRSPLSLTRNFHTCADVRRSLDSTAPSLAPSLDEAALKRSQKRARKVREMVRTEEGYLMDLKLLQNAHSTLLFGNNVGSSSKDSTARACIADLIDLHQDILTQLQDSAKLLVPYEASKFSPRPRPRAHLYSAPGPFRPFSPDLLRIQGRRAHPSLERSRASEDDLGEYLCTPQLATEIAEVFVSRAAKFVLYEEYGVRCEVLQEEANSRTTMPGVDYDRALETLQASVLAEKGRLRVLRKALGLKDLLIKPVQRITRYELLLRDLCSLMPSCDDPIAHVSLEDALFVVSQACHDLNEARGSMERLQLLDSQRRLLQRLVPESIGSQSTPPMHYGRLLLCGALFIAYRGVTAIKGQYIACILYEGHLVIATVKSAKCFVILLTIFLARATFEESNNGKGLQCHVTAHTWKLVFEFEDSLFELLFAACSRNEAEAWRNRICGRVAVETQRLAEGRVSTLPTQSPLTDDMRSVGKAYGRPVSFNRRSSVQRAATLGATTELNQVIIKGTTATGKEADASTTSLVIPRSQSVLTPSHIPVLAPRRNERIRLEGLLSDVWTKEALPFPGLGSKRGEYSVRASANHVIRKLSIASITSNFTRRSMSHASIGQSSGSDEKLPNARLPAPVPTKAPVIAKSLSRPLEAKLINFHTAPEAFLPEDFELRQPASVRGRLAGLRTFTMGIERPKMDEFAYAKDKQKQVRRSRSVDMQQALAMDAMEPLYGRSQTAMSTPMEFHNSTQHPQARQPSNRPPTADKPGRRIRARSKLARLLS